MRFFVDTNVIISAILFPEGKVARVFSHILTKHTVVISTYTKKECVEVFQKKFPKKQKLLKTFFEGIHYEEFQTPDSFNTSNYPEIRDIKDMPILVSAILSDSDILLTGDKDFENIILNKPLIFTPAKYYELLKQT